MATGAQPMNNNLRAREIQEFLDGTGWGEAARTPLNADASTRRSCQSERRTFADNDNTFVGFEAGKVANGSASGENTAIGSQAAVGLTTGVNNTVIGNDAAASLTTGSNNIVIGSDADCVAGSSNQVSIGTAASLVQILPGGLLRRSVTAGITADAGSAQGGSPLVSDINQVSVCGTTGDSVTLPAAIAGLEVTIINSGANACDVFPASGDNLGAGADTAASLASTANITYVAYNGTNWFPKT